MTSPHDIASSSYPPPPLTSSPIYIAKEAKEILGTRDLTGITELVTRIYHAKYKENSPSSPKLLFNSFTKHFPNLLTLKLLKSYRFAIAVNPKIRSFKLSLLDSLLINLEDSLFYFKPEPLEDIKTLLTECLLTQETSVSDFKLLSSIISRVSVNIFMDKNHWNEIRAFIVSFNDVYVKKPLLFFGVLLDEDFLNPLLENNLHLKIVKGLSSLDSEEEWCSALEGGFGMALQFVNLMRKDLAWVLVYLIMKSVYEMVNVENREITLRKGLIRIAMKVRREASRFLEPEYEFVSRFALMMINMNGIGKVTKEAAELIRDVLQRYYIAGGQGLINLDYIKSQCGININSA